MKRKLLWMLLVASITTAMTVEENLPVLVVSAALTIFCGYKLDILKFNDKDHYYD